MAREFPIHNGRMTTDLDANGHRIKNLPPGSGFTQVQSDWGQTDTTAPDFIKNKPTIPAPVTIDPALSPTSENPVQNKVVSKALYTGFTEWECDSISDGWTFVSCEFKTIAQIGTGWFATVNNGFNDAYLFMGTDGDAVALTKGASSGYPALSLSRNLVTPTKTSQLANDGAPNSGGTPYATTDQIPDVTGKADKAVPSAVGNLAALNAQGNLMDSGVKPSDFAAKADLPYAMVTPGEWEFSGSGYDPTKTYDIYESQGEEFYSYDLVENGTIIESLIDYSTEQVLSIEFFEGQSSSITATRPSLPGHLLDRAGNRVVVTSDTTLTLPALVNVGKARDFLVRLEISGSTVPTITFAAPTGETIVYETDGDEFPVPDEAGDWLYSFTESCVAHKFAVSLKKVNAVTQGGS